MKCDGLRARRDKIRIFLNSGLSKSTKCEGEKEV